MDKKADKKKCKQSLLYPNTKRLFYFMYIYTIKKYLTNMYANRIFKFFYLQFSYFFRLTFKDTYLNCFCLYNAQ